MATVLLSAVSISAQERKSELMNFGWHFSTGEHAEAYSPEFDDSRWDTVNLPHDASVYGPFVRDTLGGYSINGYRPRNEGWYRRSFDASVPEPGRRVILEFEGVHRDADVWLNGKHLGNQPNGYIDFEFDITDLIVPGRNTIALHYDNRFKKASRCYTGEGIYRNVWLHEVPDLRVDRYGTYVTTPRILPDSARIAIETRVVNNRADSAFCTVVSEIISPEGETVLTRRSVIPLAAGEHADFRQQGWVHSPKLWDISSPTLYSLLTQVFDSNGKTDEYRTTFGIRDIEFTPEDGFKLNGRKCFIKGVCLRSDWGPLGTAAFEDAIARRLSRMKEMGCNAIRLAHNPYPKFVADWCDRNGMLVFDEIYDEWSGQYYGEGANFKDFWPKDVETWLRRDRNHPSVFIWSVGNEVIQARNTEVHNFSTGRNEKDPTQGIDLYTRLREHVRRFDATRPVTTALFPTRHDGMRWEDPRYEYESDPAQLALRMDVLSVNYMERFFGRDKAKYPQLITLASEIDTGEGGYSIFSYDHASSVGQFYWGGTEYIGESFGWPSKGWINGASDMCDRLKPVGWSIRSLYSDEPMVAIAVHDADPGSARVWNDLMVRSKPMHLYWAGVEGDSTVVQTFSNCEEVELIVNGKSLGRRSMNECPQQRMLWDAVYEPGQIEAVGYNGGKAVAHQTLHSAGKARRIVLTPETESLKADGMSLMYVNVEVQDADGNCVPTSDYTIRFTVDGPATIAGVGNGDITSDELWQADSRTVHDGRALVILRSGRETGKVRLKAQCRGLKSASLSIASVPKD